MGERKCRAGESGVDIAIGRLDLPFGRDGPRVELGRGKRHWVGWVDGPREDSPGWETVPIAAIKAPGQPISGG